MRPGSPPAPTAEGTSALAQRLARQFRSLILWSKKRRTVDDALFARAVEVLCAKAVVDMVGLLDYYSLISPTISVFRIPPMGCIPELSDE